MLSHNLNLKIFLQEVVSFGLIGIISIFSISRIYRLNLISGTQIPAISWWQFLIAFGIGTAIVLGLIRIMHGGRFLRLFFVLALFAGMMTTLNFFLSDIWATILATAIIAIYLLVQQVWLHDLVLILTLPGIVALLGASLSPYTVAVLLVVMSIYDYIAVYKTKHMVRMAKAMIAGRAIFAMIFPEHFEGFFEHIGKAHPEEGFMMLGTGDFVFPLIMAASAFSISAATAWTIFGFSLIGLLITHILFVSQKTRRPMPALPPLAAAAILGFIVVILFNF